jgi:hypothetical protein
MAQSSESIETQPPPPEVRPAKLQSDLHPPQPEPEPHPHPQSQPHVQLNGDRPPPSAAVASTYQPSISSESLASPKQSNGNENENGRENGIENRNDGKASGNKDRSTTASGLTEAAVTGGAEATVPAASTSLHSTHVSTTQSHNGHGGQNVSRNSADAPLSPSPPMSGARPPPDGLPRQGQPAYSSPASYQPPPNMHAGAQYAYPAQIQQQQQQHDPYRASPTAVNSPMALPSMRTFDRQQQALQQQPPPQPQGYAMGAPMGQPMAGPMVGQMGLPAQAGMASGPVGMGYYSTLPATPYAMQVDPNGVRYAILPEIDPRIILANRQKKVPTPSHSTYQAFCF